MFRKEKDSYHKALLIKLNSIVLVLIDKRLTIILVQVSYGEVSLKFGL